MINSELYVLDYSRHTDILPAKVENLDMAEQVFSALVELSPGANPRFQRLVWQLRKRFPNRDDLPEDASDEEIEAYHDREAPIWIDGEAPQMDWHDDALWQPEINLTYMADFLSLLVPTARKLGLDIYTRTHGIYLPAAGMAVPTQEGSRFRLTFDPEVATPSLCNFPNKQAQQEALLACFKQVLAPHGFEAGADFVQPFFTLRRQVEGGEQVIMAFFHAFGCDFLLQTKSTRFAALNQAIAPDEANDLGLFNVWFGGVRSHVNPAWKNLNDNERFHIRNQEEVDWLLFDLEQQGLLILDKARTIKGMDWLYNSAAGAKLLPVNANSINETLAAVAYAYWAGNPDFDNIVEKLRVQLQENQDPEDCKRFEALVNYCRTEWQPIGDGAA